VSEDATDHLGILDRRNQTETATAARASENVNLENPPHQVGPFEPRTAATRSRGRATIGLTSQRQTAGGIAGVVVGARSVCLALNTAGAGGHRRGCFGLAGGWSPTRTRPDVGGHAGGRRGRRKGLARVRDGVSSPLSVGREDAVVEE